MFYMFPEVGDLSIKNMFCRAAEKGKEAWDSQELE